MSSKPETLNELKRATLASYISKAAQQIKSRAYNSAIYAQGEAKSRERGQIYAASGYKKSFNKSYGIATKRVAGIAKAAKKLLTTEARTVSSSKEYDDWKSDVNKRYPDSTFKKRVEGPDSDWEGYTVTHAHNKDGHYVASYAHEAKFGSIEHKPIKEETKYDSALVKEAKERLSARQKQLHATDAILRNHSNGLIDTKTAIRQLETNGEGSRAAQLRKTLGGV